MKKTESGVAGAEISGEGVPAVEGSKPRRKLRRVVAIATTTVLVAGLATVGGITWANERDRQTLVGQAQDLQDELAAVQRQTATAQESLLGDLEGALVFHDGLTAVLAAAGEGVVEGRLGEGPAEALTVALEGLLETITSMATHDVDAGTITLVTVQHPVAGVQVTSSTSSADARAAATRYTTDLATERRTLNAVQGSQETLGDQVAGLTAAIVHVQLMLPDTVTELLAANPLAAAAVREAFQTASETFARTAANGAELPGALTDYLEASTKLEASHLVGKQAAELQYEENPGSSRPWKPGTPGGGGSTPPPGGGGTTTPPPHVVDHTPRMRHNANYKPGCGGMTFMYSHEPGEGGTSVITVAYKYDVTTYSTPTGFGVKVYVCTDQS